MAIEIITNVLDHAPADLTATETMILVALAEWARSPQTRETERSREELAARVRCTPGGVVKALLRLAGRGIEVRVPIGMDKNGDPVYARPGQVTRYRLPVFPPPPGCTCETCRRARWRGSDSVDSPDVGDRGTVHRPGKGGPPSTYVNGVGGRPSMHIARMDGRASENGWNSSRQRKELSPPLSVSRNSVTASVDADPRGPSHAEAVTVMM